MSNIIELNKTLFKTLEGLENETVDIKKAQAIVNVSNAINSNAKLMIQAAKISGNSKISDAMIGSDNMNRLQLKDTYDQKLEFAIELGYKSMGEAISKIGKEKFEKRFKEESYANS